MDSSSTNKNIEKCMLCKTKHKPNTLQELEPGDHIQVPGRLNLYYHHAIVVDVTNIQKDGRRADIQVIDVPRKAKEGFFKTKETVKENHLLKDSKDTKCVDITRLDYRKRRHDKQTTLLRAQKATPKGKYQFFFNNCEHFATACVSGFNKNSFSTLTIDNQRVSDASHSQTPDTNNSVSYIDVKFTFENATDASNKTTYLNTFISEPINDSVVDNDTNNSSAAPASNKSTHTDAPYIGKLDNDAIYTIDADIGNKVSSQITAPQNDKHDNELEHTVDIDNSVSSQAVACFWRFINTCLLILQLATYILNFYMYAIFVGNDETFDHFDDSFSMWMRQECYNPSVTVIGFRTTCDWVVLAVLLGLFTLILCALVYRQRQLNRQKLVCKQCYKSTCCIYGFRLLVFLLVDMFNNFCERYLYRLLSWLSFSSAFTVFIIITLALVEGLYIYFVSHYLVVTLFYMMGTKRCKTLPICTTCCGTEIEEDSFEYVTIHF